jgi:hypothetical protein
MYFDYELEVAAGPAPPDQTIRVEADSGRSSAVTFRITNIEGRKAAFRAYLKYASSEFAIEPREGVLEEFGSEGTAFTLCYRARDHRVLKNRLVIETDDMLWQYALVGGPRSRRP